MNAAKYVVFGWTIHKTILVDGEQISVKFAKDTPMDISANWIFWTKGARVVTTYPSDLNDDIFIQQRGNFSNKNVFAGRVYKRGTYVLKAVGDTEFWCLDYLLNDSSAPDLEFITLNAGQTYSTSVGQLVFVASGSTNLATAPAPLQVASENLVITASTDASLIIFSRSK
jgi:hypothetical protein